MQMYKVAFTSQRGALVESGAFLVCASNAEAAEQLVSVHGTLSPSATRFDTSRVKPSIYELRRSEHRLDSEARPHRNSIGGGTDDAGAVHEISIAARVYGYSETNAVRRLAATLTEQSGPGRVPLPRYVSELDVDVQRQDARPKPSRVEEQSIYRKTRFFSGGASRPR